MTTTLRLGSASIDISPGSDCALLGYDFRQQFLPAGNAGVHDALYARALVLDDGFGPACIITLDLCIISVSHARHLRSKVATALGWPLERVLITCSHTHSGPWLDEAGIAEDVAAVLPHVQGDGGRAARRAYTAGLSTAVLEVAARAAGLLVPVQLSLRQVPLGLGYNRRVPQADGSVAQCWNPIEYPDLKPESQADPTLSVLTFRQPLNGRTWCLWSHGCHPVVLGKTSSLVSADWPGAAQRRLAEAGIEGHFLLGPCGDIHPWIATQDDPRGVDQVGAAAAAMVELCALSGGACPGRLRIASRSLTLGGREVDLAAWRIGDLTLLASPTELFAPLAADLRQRCPGPVAIITNTNGWTGYWPHTAAFAEGGYEIDAARAMGRSPGDSEALTDALLALAAECRDREAES
ncbi:MAG: hypothetical protein EA402_10955 [Planctomycetota bacterium]|nr:MAG: hypothetical protein EA402_10955 [Planctomycetota bacterium]